MPVPEPRRGTKKNMSFTQGNVIFQLLILPDLKLVATQYDTTAGGRILLRRDLQTAWAQLGADIDVDKLLTNRRRRLVLCVQQRGDVFEHLV